MNPTKQIAVVWVFASSSDCNKTYQTLLYSDASTSCECPGWTRRCNNGTRTCRHVRAVETGTADREAIRRKDYLQEAPSEAWADLRSALARRRMAMEPTLTPQTARLITLED